MRELLRFLGYPGRPGTAVELRTAAGLGYYTDTEKLVEDAQACPLSRIRLHPFPGDTARNEVSPTTEALEPTQFTTAVLAFRHPEYGVVNTTRMASDIAQRVMGGAVWHVPSLDMAYLLACVAPFPMHDDLPTNQAEWLRQVQSALAFEDAEWSIVNALPLQDGNMMVERDHVLNHSARRMLYREVPDRVQSRLNRSPTGKLARLFAGRGRNDLGYDAKGQPLPATAENFDRLFVKALAEARDNFSREEITDALWNRPGCTLRAGGLAQTAAFVDDICEEVRVQRDARPKAPVRRMPSFGPDDTLREHLYGLYYSVSEQTGGYVQRSDIEVAYRAEVVLRFLVDRGATFYHFEGSNETVFVVDGQQVMIDTGNEDYRNWFTTNVEMFTAESDRGKELTRALRTKVQAWPDTHQAEAHWGRYDGAQQRLYLCFDPHHTQVIRVEASHDGVPRVREQSNGTDQVTLRGMHHRHSRVTLVPDALKGEGWELFRDYVHNGQALCDKAPNFRLVSTMFNLCAMLPLHKHRPLKFHRGQQGSGKTAAAFDFSMVLYGQSTLGGGDYHEVVNLYRDMNTGGPITVQDNAESKDRQRFEKAYLVPASGKPTKIRKYYTESGEVVFMPHGSLSITGIEGLHRPEELRRTFEFEFERKFHTGRRLDFSTRDDYLQPRADAMLSAILELFSLYILPDFEARYQSAVHWLHGECGALLGAKRDYSDWLGRVLAIMEACGHFFVEDPDAFDARAEFSLWLQALFLADTAGRIAADPTMALLEAVRNQAHLEMARETSAEVSVGDVMVRRNGSTMVIGPFNAGQIHNTFGMLAGRYRLKIDQRNSRATLSRLRALSTEPGFADEGWTLEQAGKDRSANAYRWVARYERPGSPDSNPRTGPDPDDEIDNVIG